MKRRKRLLGGMLLGQTTLLFKKDKAFKTKFTKAEGVDKLKILATGLFDLNKSLVSELQDTQVWHSLQESFGEEFAVLNEKFEEIKALVAEYAQNPKVQGFFELAQGKFDELRKLASDLIQDASKRYDLDSKITILQQKLLTMKQKLDSQE